MGRVSARPIRPLDPWRCGQFGLVLSGQATDRGCMSSVPASPRRATYDAIALALAFLALDAVLIFAVLADWVDGDTGVVAVLAIGAVVLLQWRGQRRHPYHRRPSLRARQALRR